MRTLSALIISLCCVPPTVALAGNPAGATEALVLPNCPVMDEPIDLSISTRTDDGPVFFCCSGCIKKYTANPQKYAARVAAQRTGLENRPKVQVACPVSGEPVKSSVSVEHDGRKILFCCPQCVDKFKADPAKYQAALANSYTYQTRCPVMDKAIDPAAFNVLPTGQKIYYCCKGCDKKLLKDPAKYAPKLAAQGIHLDIQKLLEAGASGG